MFSERARFPVQVIFKFFAKLLDESQGWHRCRIAERAEGAAHHVFGEVADIVDILRRAEAGMETRQGFFEPVGSFTAGNAPAAAFVLIEADGAECEFDDAGLIVDDDYAAGAEHGSGLAD